MTDQSMYPEVTKAGDLAARSYNVALAVTVDSAAMYEIAGDELRTIVTRRKKIEELRLSLTRPIDESKRRIMDMFRSPTERLAKAEKLLRDGMTAYQRAEREKAEKARREAEAKAAAERAEQERKQREADEARRKAEADAEDARKAGDEAAAQAAAEAAAAAAAEAEDAHERMELADIAPPLQVATVTPKAAGVSTRKNWKAEITDFRALVLAAAKRAEAGDDFLLGFLDANVKALNSAAKSMQAKLSIPGVRVYADDILSVRKVG